MPYILLVIMCLCRTGLIHRPLILPQFNDIPSELRKKDGSFPRQIITPGLFKGTYSAHGIEIILFKYKDEHEIQGFKVSHINHCFLHLS